jgi:Rrf2 family nitric oxide-sensitive transcriptional repressor
MLKFNKSTMIALYAMMELAREDEDALSTAAIAERFSASRHHLAKVLQQLVRSGLVETTRGASGGHHLARAPKDIDLLEIVEIFEGRRSERANCLLLEEGGTCRSETVCDLHGILKELDEQVQFTLRSVSLKTLINNKTART